MILAPELIRDAEPLPRLEQWAEQLRRISSQPLQYCPRFPEVAARHEAWWRQEADRPLFLATTAIDPTHRGGRRIDLLRDDPERWLEVKLADLDNTRFLGDAVPHIRLDLGPACLGAMIGGARELGSDTAWTHATIDDNWSNAGPWSLREDNIWWRRLREMSARLADHAAGRFIVEAPDLGGASDTLLSMRGSTEACMDALEQPDQIREALDRLYPIWREAITTFYDQVLNAGAGVFHWLQVWSNRPYVLPTCDFNFMLGPKQFQSVCLPDIDRLSRSIDRTLIHVDGPQATRHIDALLEIPTIQAIQYTPGEGTPEAMPYVDILRRVQDRGRSLLIASRPEEVGPLCEALRPESLTLLVLGSGEPLEAAWRDVQQRFGSE